MEAETLKKNFFKRTFTGHRARNLREYLTAYLFISPALLLIFIFGIFPVGFALYVSLHKWRLKRTDFVGLGNYIKAVDNLAYVVAYFLAIAALIGAFLLIRRIVRLSRERQDKPWLFALPALIHAAAAAAFLRWAYVQLPEVLDIGDKVRSLEKTREVFIQLLGEAFRAESVQPAWTLFIILFLVSLGIWIVSFIYRRNPHGPGYQAYFMLSWLGLIIGIGLAWFTSNEIFSIYKDAVETGSDPGIWPQVVTISAGIILLVLAWFIWQGIGDENGNGRFWMRVLATMFLMVGGWMLIGQIPMVVASGDKDMWQGLKVTLFYSIGTVPFQLSIAMFLSILLFQKLRGSNMFRIIYFLPYVTPAVASAAVFKQMFSTRETAPINLLVRALGLNAQRWVYEPAGVFTMIADKIGLGWPEWAAGPSLALGVIILHSIWTYVGYDTVIYLAGLGNIPKELVDAAEVDGANKWEVFRHIIFPLLSPTTYFLSLIAIIGTFKAFNSIWIFRGIQARALGTTDTFSVVIFVEFFEKLRYGYASALAFVLFAIILSLTLINNRVQGSKVFYG